MLDKLLALQAEHDRLGPDRRLSVLFAALLLGITDQDRELLRMMAQQITARDMGHALGIKEAAVRKRAKVLAQKMRLNAKEFDRLAKEFAQFAA